jgi:hypothetical protein
MSLLIFATGTGRLDDVCPHNIAPEIKAAKHVSMDARMRRAYHNIRSSRAAKSKRAEEFPCPLSFIPNVDLSLR